MRIAISAVQVPFIQGGAEILSAGLVAALQRAGHEVEKITLPFRFAPISEVKRSMEIWSKENFELLNGYALDLVICLQFPSFYLQHPHKVAWLLHQHRAVYELWNTAFTSGFSEQPEAQTLRLEIHQRDSECLKTFKQVYTIAQTISDRLTYFNQIPSTPLYHPPKLADQFYTAPALPYIFFPSRLESLKRQDLLIQAMQFVKSPVVALIAGEGGQKNYLQAMVENLNLKDKVRLIGRLNDQEMLGVYACCLGVFFAPYQEDYGYVTLEAMLAAKPILTCTDSGGPLEFVIDGETGYILAPEPGAIAAAIDNLYFQQQKARKMGESGKARYQQLNISWDNVIQRLLFG